MKKLSLFHQTKKELQSEQEMIDQTKKDVSHFEFLYKKYRDKIFHYILKRVKDRSLAEDLTSQVFLKAIENIERYEFRGVPFSSWLYRIAVSEINQSYRDSKKRQEIELQKVNYLFALFEEPKEKNEDLSQLRIVMSQLKEIEVDLIKLRFFERYSYKEIGDILGITENNAKVKTYRTLQKMKNFLMIYRKKTA